MPKDAAQSEAFKLFCAREGLQHSRLGCPGPSSILNLQSVQWYDSAWRYFVESNSASAAAERNDATAGGSKAGLGKKRKRGETTENPDGIPPLRQLADELRSSIRETLDVLSSPACPPALEAVASTPFPTPRGPSEIQVMLQTFDAAVRLSALCPSDTVAAMLRDKCLPHIQDLKNRGHVADSPGHYPSLSMLLELFLAHKLFARWDTIEAPLRLRVLDQVQALLEHCRSASRQSAIDRVLTALATARGAAGHALFVDEADERSVFGALREVIAAVPFQFSATDETLRAAGFALLPDLVLHLHSSSDDSDATDDEGGSDNDGDDVLVGDIIAARDTPPAPQRRPQQGRQHPAPPPSLLPQEQQQQQTRRGPSPSSIATPASNVVTSSGKLACRSKYHAKYGDPRKHASRSCQFCNGCHMLEILFNGCKHDCLWGHWPTERKLRLSFGKFPHVLQLASKQFDLLQRGVALPASNALPTS